MNSQRGQLGEGAVLTVAEACRQLGGGKKARAWLVERGLIVDVAGLGRRVIWRRVLAALEGSDPCGSTEQSVERQVVQSRPLPPLPRASVKPRR